MQSPCTSPIVTNKDLGFLRHCDSTSNTNQQSDNENSNNSTNNIQQLRSRINSFKMSVFTTPKFYRRKILSNFYIKIECNMLILIKPLSLFLNFYSS